MKTCLFIINPSSGTKTIQKKLDKMIGQMVLQQIINHVDIFYTEKKDDAYYRCLDIQESDYDFIVSVGGDGTVNEIINGLVEKKIKTPLAILPGGTVNDFANHLKLPLTPKNFIKMIKDMNIISVDIGNVNGRYFANVLAGGMFSDISFQVSKGEKEIFGPIAYYLSGIRQLPSQLSTHLHLKIKTENEEFEEDARLFMITNTSQVGGFKDIAPHANIQDGQMDLLIIKKCSTPELISILKDYTFTSHTNSKFTHYLQAKDIYIECDKDIIYDIDGEEGTSLPIHVTVEELALNLIIPK
ncbi:MAG: diacylglycerol kinase family lipid kinase [Coprobacillus sp.]